MTTNDKPGFFQRLRNRARARETTRELQSLGPHILRDIGLNPDDISAAAIGRRADDYFRR